MSLSGKEYMVVFYDEDSNSIHVEPANSRSSTDRVAAYTRGEAYFRNCGFTPRFEYLDNEISAGLMTFFANEDIDYQLTPHPHIFATKLSAQFARGKITLFNPCNL